MEKIPSTLLATESNNRWLILIISIFQIICLLFYLEIFEFNFCSLNENTKRNIEERMINESKENTDDIDNNGNNDDRIIIKGYDITDGINKQDIEMKEINEEESEKND